MQPLDRPPPPRPPVSVSDRDPATKQQDGFAQTEESAAEELTETRFPCQQCGAVQTYKIGSDTLECAYCGHRHTIVRTNNVLQENDLHSALRQLQTSARLRSDEQQISCPNCAATFALGANIHAGECPFCGTSVVTETTRNRPIKPKGILPFAVTADQAQNAYQDWLKRLWFAPNALDKYARKDAPLNGVYMPYWTYDSNTATTYQGERGEIYYVTQRYTTTKNGRTVTRTKKVPKVRWYPSSGRTRRRFDDVLVGATKTLPRKITDWLSPWDLQALESYNEAYLAGFSSEVYQVDLDEGFTIAQKKMDQVIRQDVRRAIGGDRQRIHRLSTQHKETSFKHILLPLWTAGFQFGGKTYRFVVNGRTGKVRGERPYSVVKIALAVVAAGCLAATGLYLYSQTDYYAEAYGLNSLANIAL